MSFLTLSLLFFVVIIISYLLNKWFKKQSAFLRKLQNIPGPKSGFLVGNSLDVRSCHELLQKLMEHQNEFGLTFKMQLGFKHYVLTADPALIEYIVLSSKELTKTQIYKFMANWIGDGLICAGNPKWQHHRHLIRPTFHLNVLKEFIPTFNKNADNLVRHWRNHLQQSGNEIEVHNYITACTLDVICETTMGVNVNALNDDNQSKYLEGVRFMGQTIIERTLAPWRHFDTLYKLSPMYQKEIELVEYVHRTTENIIRYKQSMATETNNKMRENDLGIKTRMSFLDHLLTVTKENGGSLTDKELRDEVHTIIFSGHHSTAASISFTLFLLATHPDIQQQVYNEITSLICEDEEITYLHLINLKYLEMVIKESLRLYPPAVIYLRKLVKDVNLDGLILPKDINIGVFAYGAHRNPKIFNEPDTFNPERFSPENTTSRNRFSYLPFSAGPRNCIGQKFAMLEMKCIMAHLIRTFKFSKPEGFDIQPTAAGVLISRNGVRLILEERTTK